MFKCQVIILDTYKVVYINKSLGSIYDNFLFKSTRFENMRGLRVT